MYINSNGNKITASNQVKQRNNTLLRPNGEPASPKFSEKRMFDVLYNE